MSKINSVSLGFSTRKLTHDFLIQIPLIVTENTCNFWLESTIIYTCTKFFFFFLNLVFKRIKNLCILIHLYNENNLKIIKLPWFDILGTSVIRIVASDPDGPDADLSYFIYNGAKDNFVLNQKTGLLTVATGADLDRDQYGEEYKIIVSIIIVIIIVF